MEKIGDDFEHFFEKQGLLKRLKETQSILLWNKVVGYKISEKTQPLYVQNGILYVYVQSPVWHSELTFMKDDIIKNLCKKMGGEFIKDIKFTAKRIK